VRQPLIAPHAGKSCQRHVEAAGGLLDGVGQQRMWCQFGENPIPVL
jgi:hypothetical protein